MEYPQFFPKTKRELFQLRNQLLTLAFLIEQEIRRKELEDSECNPPEEDEE